MSTHTEELAELDEHAPHLHGQGAVALRDPRPALGRRAPETAHHGAGEQDVPPDGVQEGAGDEGAQLAVALEVDPPIHEPHDAALGGPGQLREPLALVIGPIRPIRPIRRINQGEGLCTPGGHRIRSPRDDTHGTRGHVARAVQP